MTNRILYSIIAVLYVYFERQKDMADFNLFEKLGQLISGKPEQPDDFVDVLNLDDSETDVLMAFQGSTK